MFEINLWLGALGVSGRMFIVEWGHSGASRPSAEFVRGHDEAAGGGKFTFQKTYLLIANGFSGLACGLRRELKCLLASLIYRC